MTDEYEFQHSKCATGVMHEKPSWILRFMLRFFPNRLFINKRKLRKLIRELEDAV